MVPERVDRQVLLGSAKKGVTERIQKLDSVSGIYAGR